MILYNVAVFLGLAVASALTAVAVALSLAWIHTRILARGRTCVPPTESENLECRQITKVFTDAPGPLAMNENHRANPKPATTAGAASQPVRFIPYEIKTTYRREEWHTTPLRRLLPNPNWN